MCYPIGTLQRVVKGPNFLFLSHRDFGHTVPYLRNCPGQAYLRYLFEKEKEKPSKKSSSIGSE